MLRDTVCDEATNNARCLYDGGDCCLEFKNTKLCKNCTCVLSVDLAKLQTQFIDNNIKPLEKVPSPSYNNNNNNPRKVVHVFDVISSAVCAVLCLDHSLGDLINTWQYNAGVCTCSWILSWSCYEKRVDSDWSLINVQGLTTPNNDTFVQLNKIVPCGRIFSEICLPYYSYL